MPSNQYLTFLLRFLHNPKQIGSIIPSSRFLAEKMIHPIPWKDIHAMAELGAGTGAITRYIEACIPITAQVLLFEMDAKMREDLQLTYSNFECHANANSLTRIMDYKGIAHLDCIISGLPFFNFSPELRESLLNQINQALKPGGMFIAFQYSLQMKKLLSAQFVIEHIDFTPLNVPPAFVYICRKN